VTALQPGLYLVHKPVGQTSHQKMRELPAGKLPVCHAGTLDPFAEGLLIVLAGAATRLMDLIHEAPKRYLAEVAWGVETDTGDAGGKPVRTGDAAALTPARLDEALPSFKGWTQQVPPDTSAKKIRGEPAYKLAHRGEPVVLPPSRVYLHDARWLSHDLPRSSRLELTCRGGFYVRALARDLGRAVGACAHLTTLHRSAIGPWEDPGGHPEWSREGWVHGEGVLPWYRSRELNGDELYALKDERTIPRGEVRPATWTPPEGFPEPTPRVRAFSRGALVALLEGEARLRVALRLPGGV
jgi:tRNA pseudouridine55 synthase